MKHPHLKAADRNRRGFILAVSMILLFICAVGATLLARTVMDHRGLADRRSELARAFYAAEAGVNQVVHWTIQPADYSADELLFARDSQGAFSTLSSATNSNSIAIPEALLPVLVSETGEGVSTVKSLEILKPGPSDPSDSLFKIKSVGRSPKGIEKTVVYYAKRNDLGNARFPAALMSAGAAAVGGNFRIHWGEAWAKGNMGIPARSQMAYLLTGDANYDSKVKYRTEGTLIFPNNWKWGNNKNLFDPTRSDPGATPASGEYAGRFEQKLLGALNFPQYDYESWKSFARSRNKYYSTNESGDVFKGEIESDETLVRDFLAEFGAENREETPYDLAFIDTTNGLPPAANGSNLATIRISGASNGMKGIFYFCANVDATGIGNPPPLETTDPNGVPVVLDKILIEGALITPGQVSFGGNTGIYGAVYAGAGFSATGTPDIYYNSALASGIPEPAFASPITLALGRAE